MDRSSKSTGTQAPRIDAAPLRKPGIGKPAMTSMPAFQPVRKKKWSDAQFAQSRKFWEKKAARQFRQLDARRVRAEDTFMQGLPAARSAELRQHSEMKLVSRNRPMPNATMSMLPSPAATRNYADVMRDVSEFLDPRAPVRSTFNEGGPQLIQQFQSPGVGTVTRRVGVDVEPSEHVRKLRPHLNLQTQHNGVVQKGPGLADPHHPVRSFDPFRGSGRGPAHPLQGQLAPDERRAFMERHLHSQGIPIERE